MNWAAIAAVVAVVSVVLGIGTQLILNSRSHGRIEGAVNTTLQAIDARQNRYEQLINAEQANQWSAVNELRDDLKNHEGRISYLEGKSIGKSATASHSH